ncbi:MAG: hypothetical protein KC933_23505 [Myxococcales bacterium]|nr:hypothetical protein [Myxococcales bacterium]
MSYLLGSLPTNLIADAACCNACRPRNPACASMAAEICFLADASFGFGAPTRTDAGGVFFASFFASASAFSYAATRAWRSA